MSEIRHSRSCSTYYDDFQQAGGRQAIPVCVCVCVCVRACSTVNSQATKSLVNVGVNSEHRGVHALLATTHINTSTAALVTHH